MKVCAVVEGTRSPGRNPLLAPLGAVLADRGIELVSWDPTAGMELPPRAPVADLYLLKADHPAALSAAGCLHDAGARCLNPFPETAAAHDKPRTLARLARAGLPVPATRLVAEREDLAVALAEGAKFVKPILGAHGVGAARVELATEAGDGPWLVQEVVTSSQWVFKVYGVGERAAVRRVWFEPEVVDAVREPVFEPELIRLAIRAAEVVGLECFGADFVFGHHGPILVDLNAFPGYRGVAEAPGWVADAVSRGLSR